MTSSANNGPSDVSGVLPGGVVSITAIYDRVVSQGPYNNPKIYPSRVVREVRVQDNVVDFTVPRGAAQGFPSRMIWHLSNGSTVLAPNVTVGAERTGPEESLRQSEAAAGKVQVQ